MVGGFELIFVDQSEVHLNSPLTKVGARRGERARDAAAGDGKKAAVFGGWNYRSEQFAWQISERKNSGAFLSFLGQLLQQRPEGRRLILVMDNAGYHRVKTQRFLPAALDQRLVNPRALQDRRRLS